MRSTDASLSVAIASLKEWINQRFDELDLRYQKQLGDMDRRHDQRFDEADLRYQQRFDAQTTALGAAATAAEKAIGSALDATEKAMVKAETANEKRFDSVNEFRAQLRDQAATFIPRIEASSDCHSSLAASPCAVRVQFRDKQIGGSGAVIHLWNEESAPVVVTPWVATS